jgi:acyl-CoA reductase-like NAD-dependent aldehyde dehydrogenase
MRLYVATMDAVVVEFAPDGRVRFDNEDWTRPTVQERRAIIHAAKNEIESLKELLEILETSG